jgi:putative ABC transport system ATP-binding protein
MHIMIELRDITKSYRMGALDICALCGVSLSVERGELIAVMGPSGSGKSTLLHVLGCLDRPTGGSYTFESREISAMNDDDLALVRNARIGFVFQSFNLLPRFSALKNVEMPLIYSGISAKRRTERAKPVLEQVGLQDRMEHKPSELSGGQQQRVAIARALVNNPSLLLADEPTGNLDSRSGEEILNILVDLNRQGMTIMIVTHDRDIADRCRRIINLKDGRLVGDRFVA